MRDNYLLLIIGLYILSKANVQEFDQFAFLAFVIYASKNVNLSIKKSPSDSQQSDGDSHVNK